MPSAREARDWARSGGLRGIGDSLYTPFSGIDGDEIDYDAYRALVRYCVGDLKHPMLWLTSGIAEWWSLTIDERKRLTEIAIEEARAIDPTVVIQACTAANSAKDAVELTLHAQEAGADIAYIQTPPMELHGGEGVLRFFQYVADRTDIALGLFNSPSSNYVMTPQEVARIAEAVPAVCATKEGAFRPYASKALHALAPDLVIWECDLIVYRAGWLQEGIVTGAQLGTCGYLYETPDDKRYTAYFQLIEAGDIPAAAAHAKASGIDRFSEDMGTWFTKYPGRPDYFTHWGAAFRYAASVMGLPMGDYAESRPPQWILPEEAKAQLRRAVENAGYARALAPTA
ncbi:dihydrodipicolinate synthase family protein [Trujillonella endophytica]|uniref:4-hydroxy-tetrahydrodipicolinate synthase n=1 Tax=Trujillonella endophytica TaxID=673521 RepID=A0A1H8QKX8_9ACTN|nr:dihydrodipicolinate synthase family protein [Trujillella endophytica]SEO54668.1 4-hydroxy-tetrahydrodipicolinate synthase [Trujillella endophytica]